MNRPCIYSLFLLISFTTLPVSDSFAADESKTRTGQSIYNYRCYFCHGYSGDASTLAATYMAIKPTNFQSLAITEVDRQEMIDAVTSGRENTPMVGFSRLLSRQEIINVVDYVLDEFIVKKNRDARYHSKANGWENHDRYAIANPFATGVIALDKPWEELTPMEQKGKRFYLKYCITCHDRGRVQDEGEHWSTQTFSYPRNGYDHRNPTQHYDGVSSASVYAYHDQQPDILLNSPYQRMGRELYQKNCAFCHAADGSGRNWIGSFLEPKPRDFNQPDFMSQMDSEFLLRRIKKGIPNSSMPAWESVLSEHQIASIIDYMRIAFHAGAGGN